MSPKTFTRSTPAAGEAPIPAASNENHEIGEARQVSQGVTHANEIEQGPRTLTGRSDHPTKPVLIDLYCCAGGAAKGYQRAGFYVIGVDRDRQPNYCGDQFVQADALEFLHDNILSYAIQPAAIHASPPCQHFLNLGAVNRALGRDYDHADLIAATRELLERTGLPYVIENVPDAKSKLIDPVRVCGTSFGLPLRRHRLFESNVPLKGTPCAHDRFSEPRYWTGWRPKGEHRLSTVVQVYGNAGDKHEWPAAMGIDWMTNDELAEAIPPAYTELIGTQLLAHVQGEAIAA